MREKKKEEKRIGAEVFPGIVLHTEIDVDPRVLNNMLGEEVAAVLWC